MRPAERYAAIQAISGFVASLSEREADKLLSYSEAGLQTPSGWDDLSKNEKLDAIKDKLREADDTSLETLLEVSSKGAVKPPSKLMGGRLYERFAAIREISSFLARLSEKEAERVSDISGFGMWFGYWNDEHDFNRRRTELAIDLWDQDDEMLDTLLEFLPESKKAPPVKDVPAPLKPPEIAPVIDEATRITVKPSTPHGPIFLVHGHSPVVHEVARFLEPVTGRNVIILHEQANSGRTILEKFEEYAASASFAVVLLTGDDTGGVKSSGKVQLRGRQNVIFELGFFFGKLGRRRVVVLLEEEVEKPSDIAGLVYHALDNAGAWKQALVRELEAVDIAVDRSRIP